MLGLGERAGEVVPERDAEAERAGIVQEGVGDEGGEAAQDGPEPGSEHGRDGAGVGEGAAGLMTMFLV